MKFSGEIKDDFGMKQCYTDCTVFISEKKTRISFVRRILENLKYLPSHLVGASLKNTGLREDCALQIVDPPG